MARKSEEVKTDLPAVQESTAVAVVAEDDDLLAALEESGKTTEALGKDDMAVPFLQLVQALSPVCKRASADYDPEAREGMVRNSVTGKLYKTFDEKTQQPMVAFRMVPLAYVPCYLEWIPRENNGGGFVAEYSVPVGAGATTMRDAQNRDIIQPDSRVGTPGNQLSYTHVHYVYVLDDEGKFKPAVLSLSSTQIKVSKVLNAAIAGLTLPNGARAPRFYGVFDVSARTQVKGENSWALWHFQEHGTIMDLPTRKKLVESATTFISTIGTSEMQIDHSQAGPVADTLDAGVTVTDDDTKTPF